MQLDPHQSMSAQPSPAASFDTPGAMRRLNETYGLSWREIANLFGVSSRTTHHWANGTPMRQRDIDRLSRAIEIVAEHRVDGDPAQTRAALMAPPAQGGLSPYRQALCELRHGAMAISHPEH